MRKKSRNEKVLNSATFAIKGMLVIYVGQDLSGFNWFMVLERHLGGIYFSGLIKQFNLT